MVALVHKLLNPPACTRGSIAHRRIQCGDSSDENTCAGDDQHRCHHAKFLNEDTRQRYPKWYGTKHNHAADAGDTPLQLVWSDCHAITKIHHAHDTPPDKVESKEHSQHSQVGSEDKQGPYQCCKPADANNRLAIAQALLDIRPD